MHKKNLVLVIAMIIGFGLSVSVFAQAPSLVDLAKKERARKSPQAQGKVFTNEDVGTGAPKPSPEPATAATAPTDGTERTAPTDAAAAAEPSQADLEKEYKEKFARLKEEVAYEEKKLDVLQRELNLMQIQNYSDPNVALREQNTREEITKRLAEIDTQKQAVDKAKQAVSDLEEELRKKSLPVGWAR